MAIPRGAQTVAPRDGLAAAATRTVAEALTGGKGASPSGLSVACGSVTDRVTCDSAPFGSARAPFPHRVGSRRGLTASCRRAPGWNHTPLAFSRRRVSHETRRRSSRSGPRSRRPAPVGATHAWRGPLPGFGREERDLPSECRCRNLCFRGEWPESVPTHHPQNCRPSLMSRSP